jgi:hypothetical protein
MAVSRKEENLPMYLRDQEYIIRQSVHKISLEGVIFFVFQFKTPLQKADINRLKLGSKSA